MCSSLFFPFFLFLITSCSLLFFLLYCLCLVSSDYFRANFIPFFLFLSARVYKRTFLPPDDLDWSRFRFSSFHNFQQSIYGFDCVSLPSPPLPSPLPSLPPPPCLFACIYLLPDHVTTPALHILFFPLDVHFLSFQFNHLLCQ